MNSQYLDQEQEQIIQAAFKQGLIENGERWIDIMLARNSLSNLYDEETSREIYYKIKEIYVKEFKRLEEKLNGIQKGEKRPRI